MKKLIFVLAIASTSFSQPTITWTHQPNSGTVATSTGQIGTFYAPVLGCTYIRAIINGASGIYSTNDFCYHPLTNTFVNLGGTGDLVDGCPGGDQLTQPADRHTDDQIGYDGLRNYVWMRGGLNVNCAAYTIGHCTNPGSEIPTCSFYANHLTSSPVNNWNFVDVASGSNLWQVANASLKYDPDHDALVGWGGSNQTGSGQPYILHCMTDHNPTPGTLTAAQLAINCATPDGWDYYFPNQGIVNVVGNNVTSVSGDIFPVGITYINIGGTGSPTNVNGTIYQVTTRTDATHLVIAGGVTASSQQWFVQPLGILSTSGYWDTATHAFYYFGGQFTNLTTNFNEIWKFDPTTKKFVQVAVGQTCYPNQGGAGNLNRIGVAYAGSRHLFYIHNSTGTGAPNDWQYDPVADSCIALTNVGSGPTLNSLMTFDETAGELVTFGNASGGTPFEVWTATVTSNTTSSQFRSLGTWSDGSQKHVEGCGIIASMGANTQPTVTVNGVSGGNFTLQEELYPGDQTGSNYTSLVGIARTNEPFCMDIPIAKGVITSLSSLSFTGTASVTNANMATDNHDCTGASDSNRICINTGAAKFQIKKNNTNIIDAVTIGSTAVVTTDTSATHGLVLTGPNPTLAYPANTVCTGGSSTCTTLYSSANDASSTCSIVVNGPIKVLVRCNGNLIDGASHVYQHHTTYLTFYVGESYVLPEVALRNADFGANTGTFETAYKQLKGWELRLPLQGSPTNYKIYSYTGDTNCTSAICTGTIAGTSGAFLYQGYSQFLFDNGISSTNGWTVDQGFTIQNNGSQITSGTITQIPAGGADCSNSSGVGAAIGLMNMAAEWPSSLECVGSDIRIGVYSNHNGIISSTVTYPFLPWPQWLMSKMFIEFHTSAPTNPNQDFLRAQLQLDGRPIPSYLNTTLTNTYPVPTATQMDTLLQAGYSSSTPTFGVPTLTQFCFGGVTPCMGDFNTGFNSNYYLQDYRIWGWGGTGGATQLDSRRGNWNQWITYGLTGRYLDSKFFWKFSEQNGWPHSDGASSTDSTVNNFTWRSKTGTDSFGRPSNTCSGGSYVSANCSSWNIGQNWWDDIHFWWSSALDSYFWTGDELVKESLVSASDWYLNTTGAQNGNCPSCIGITRGNAAQILTGSQFSEYLNSIGDTSDGATVLAQVENNITQGLVPDLCVSDASSTVYPTGCTLPTLSTASGNDPSGVSRVRGSVASSSMRSSNFQWCNNSAWGGAFPVGVRIDAPYFDSMLVNALINYRRQGHTAYTNYVLSGDLLYGLVQNSLGPNGFTDNGNTRWWDDPTWTNTAPTSTLQGLTPVDEARFNGFRFAPAIDISFQCSNSPSPAINNVGVTYDVLQYGTGGGAIVVDGQSDAGSNGNGSAGVRGSVYGHFLGEIYVNGALTSSDLRKLHISMQWQAALENQNAPDLYSYELSALAAQLGSPTGLELQDIPFTLTPLGGLNYNVTTVIPTGTTQVRVKWSPKVITNSGAFSSIIPSASDGMLGFEPVVTRVFSLNPSTYATWFGAIDATPGSFVIGSNTFSVTTSGSGFAANQFSVKVMAPPITAPPTITNSVSNKIDIGGGVRR